MRAVSILLIIFALIFGGAYYGAPWYIGQQIATQKDSLIFKPELESAGVTVENISYQQGVRESQAVYRLGDSSESVEIEQVIQHGPLLHFNDQWQNGFALVKTKMKTSNGEVLPEHELLTFLDWDENMRNQLTIPAGQMNQDGQNITWQSLVLSFDVNADQSFNYGMAMDGLEMHNAERHLVLGKVSAEGQQNGRDLNAEGTFRIQSLAVAPVMNLLDFSQSARLHDEGSTLRLESETTLAQLEVLGKSWNNANITINLKNLDKEAIAAIQDNAAMISASPLIMLQILPKLLAASPEISIPNASVDSPEGKIELNLLLTIDGSQSFMSPTALLDATTLDGNVRLPESYAVLLLAQGQDAEIAQEKIRKLSDLGALIRRNDQVIVKFRLHRGGLTLNDNPFAIDELAAILQ